VSGDIRGTARCTSNSRPQTRQAIPRNQTLQISTMLCSLTVKSHASGTCHRPAVAAVACRPTGTLVARATPRQQQLQQQLQFEQDTSSWFTAESRWRLFGFGATACTQSRGKSADGTEYVSMAAYDLTSGELFSALINPKLHDPGYRLLSSRLRGRCCSCLQAHTQTGMEKCRAQAAHGFSSVFVLVYTPDL
jgi:hypothetical protein